MEYWCWCGCCQSSFWKVWTNNSFEMDWVWFYGVSSKVASWSLNFDVNDVSTYFIASWRLVTKDFVLALRNCMIILIVLKVVEIVSFDFKKIVLINATCLVSEFQRWKWSFFGYEKASFLVYLSLICAL